MTDRQRLYDIQLSNILSLLLYHIRVVRRKGKFMENIKEVAEYVIRELKQQGFFILRYDAYTTNSIYLKLDCGVAKSIRISDHQGKKHLRYSYNLLKHYNGKQFVKDNGFWRQYFNFKQVDVMIGQIVKDRKYLMDKLGGEKQYEEQMLIEWNKNKDSKIGFWKDAKIV